MVSQNLQNNAKLKKYVCGDCTTVRRRKAAGWRAFPTKKTSFDGFVCFVTKEYIYGYSVLKTRLQSGHRRSGA